MNQELYEVKIDSKTNTYRANLNSEVAKVTFEKIHGKINDNQALQAKLKLFMDKLQAKIAEFNQKNHRILEYTQSSDMTATATLNNATRKAVSSFQDDIGITNNSVVRFLWENSPESFRTDLITKLGMTTLYLEANGANPRPTPPTPSTTPDATQLAPPNGGIIQTERPWYWPKTQVGLIGRIEQFNGNRRAQLDALESGIVNNPKK